MHGTGRCSFARHGTHVRRTACGEAHVARWHCPVLTEAARQAHPDPDVGANAARRWQQRRRDAVHACLRVVLITLVPDRVRLRQPSVLSLRDRLGHADVLPILCALLALRGMLVLGPIGVSLIENATFSERAISPFRCQQSMGPDPPAISGRLVARLRDRCLAATCESPDS